MTVIVLDPGPAIEVAKKTICRNCGATLQYTPSDTRRVTERDYAGGSDTYIRINCPQCRTMVTVS